MTAPPPLLVAALRAQLALRQAALDAGAERVGWKLGMGERERIGAGPVVGHLTSATVLRAGSTAAVGAFGVPRADVEVAIEFQAPVDPRGGADAVVLGDGRSTTELASAVAAAARLLDAVGERVEAGDVVITGSIVQVPVHAGQDVVARLDGHGAAELTLVS